MSISRQGTNIRRRVKRQKYVRGTNLNKCAFLSRFSVEQARNGCQEGRVGRNYGHNPYAFSIRYRKIVADAHVYPADQW